MTFKGAGFFIFSNIVGIMRGQCSETLMKLNNAPCPKSWAHIFLSTTSDARPRHFILSLVQLRVHDRVLTVNCVLTRDQNALEVSPKHILLSRVGAITLTVYICH